MLCINVKKKFQAFDIKCTVLWLAALLPHQSKHICFQLKYSYRPVGHRLTARIIYKALNEEVGFKIPTTRSRNNSVFCGALL